MKYLLPGLLVLLLTPALPADDKPDALDALKKTAKENWDRVEAGPMVEAASTRFLVVAPKAMGDKLKEHLDLFEKHYDLVFKTIHKEKDIPFKRHVTVYLLPEADMIDSFIRRIEKRRPQGREKGSINADDDRLHVAAGPPREKTDPAVEIQAAQQVAALMLQRRAGKSTILPYWLLNGFGRATYYRVMPNNTLVKNERVFATNLIRVKKRTAMDVWNGVLDGEEPGLLDPALADFLAYGPGKMKFVTLLEGFRPGENEDKKTMEQALMAADLKPDLVNKTFRTWALRPN